MSTEIKNVMVLGGRGNLGPYLIKALVKAGFNVSVLSRTSSNVTESTFLGATIVKSDYTFSSLVGVFTGQDAVISTLSTANIAEQKIVIDAVAAAKVKRYNKDLYARATKHIEEGNWGRGYYELATATVYSDAPVTYFPDKAAHWMKVLGLVQEETFDEMITRVLKTV
ncbi:hypothetical protein H9Q71_005425 [Fusarium xylarioides]|nr:hypothetical protein H9Q71_005425 [Fusarium xylarioides]